jgi:hypothetical protein
MPDQLSAAEMTSRIISNSSWHQDKSLQQYFNPKTGAVLCISSFTDPVELEELLERCDSSTVIYFVKTSNTLRSFAALNLLSRLIFLPPQDRRSKLRTRWTFSPIRLQVEKREKKIEVILGKSSVKWGIL